MAMYANEIASTSTPSLSSPTDPSSLAIALSSVDLALSNFDVSTHGDGPFRRPVICEETWTSIPLEYRPVNHQFHPQPQQEDRHHLLSQRIPIGRRRSECRSDPTVAENRSRSAQTSRGRQRSADAWTSGRMGHQRRASPAAISTTTTRSTRTTSMPTSGTPGTDKDRPKWFTSLVSTVKPKRSRRSNPISADITTLVPPSPGPKRPPMIITSSNFLAPPQASSLQPATAPQLTSPASPTNTAPVFSQDSVYWDPERKVWRRHFATPSNTSSPVVPTSSSASAFNQQRTSYYSPAMSPVTPTFPYSDYTCLDDDSDGTDRNATASVAEQRQSHRTRDRRHSAMSTVSAVSIVSTVSAVSALADELQAEHADDEEPPPCYVQSQWEVAQERQRRLMQLEGAPPTRYR